jgi:hypothetical protein
MDQCSIIGVWESALWRLNSEDGLVFDEGDVMAFGKWHLIQNRTCTARQINDIVRSAKELAIHEHTNSLRARRAHVPWSESEQPLMTAHHLRRAAKACEYLNEEDGMSELDVENLGKELFMRK